MYTLFSYYFRAGPMYDNFKNENFYFEIFVIRGLIKLNLSSSVYVTYLIF